MKYQKLPSLTWDGQMYENEDMGVIEALLPNGNYPSAHAPALLELANGDLLCFPMGFHILPCVGQTVFQFGK